MYQLSGVENLELSAQSLSWSRRLGVTVLATIISPLPHELSPPRVTAVLTLAPYAMPQGSSSSESKVAMDLLMQSDGAVSAWREIPPSASASCVTEAVHDELPFVRLLRVSDCRGGGGESEAKRVCV